MSPLHLSPEQLRQAVAKLPSLPSAVMELIASLHDPDVDSIARKIGQDPGLTAKVLRLANSSFYGMARQVSSVDQAVTVLGFRAVGSIATAAALVRQGQAMAPAGMDLKPLWRHALGCALAARELASASAHAPDTAYTSGLLHDIGRLVLWTQFAKEQSAVAQYREQHDCHWAQAETAVLGTDHGEIGSLLCQHWQLPAAIAEAVAFHHRCEMSASSLPLLVAGADAIAHALSYPQDPQEAVPPLPPQLWDRLHISEERLLRSMQAVRPQLDAMELLLIA